MRDRLDASAYRLFWINEAGQVDAVAEPIAAEGDEDAIRQARQLAEGNRVELWRGARLVVALAAAPPSSKLH